MEIYWKIQSLAFHRGWSTRLFFRLKDALHAASLDRQRKYGRVVVRRLNGTEYENTVRDLLGNDVNLKELLPEDNSTSGFDNVSAALDVSASHQILYQEAAERAVMSVIPPHPPVPFRDRRTGSARSPAPSAP